MRARRNARSTVSAARARGSSSRSGRPAMKAAVVGASGYTGLELLRLAEFEMAAVTSEQRAGREVAEVFPALRERLDLRFEAVDPASLAGRVELAFTALPHAASARAVAALRGAGCRVVDLSADFRIRDLTT